MPLVWAQVLAQAAAEPASGWEFGARAREDVVAVPESCERVGAGSCERPWPWAAVALPERSGQSREVASKGK